VQQYGGRHSGAVDAKGMPIGPGETLQNVVGWRWKSQQSGDAVKRQAGGGTMVGGSMEDRSGCGRHVARWKTPQKVEGVLEGGRRSPRRKGIV